MSSGFDRQCHLHRLSIHIPFSHVGEPCGTEIVSETVGHMVIHATPRRIVLGWIQALSAKDEVSITSTSSVTIAAVWRKSISLLFATR